MKAKGGEAAAFQALNRAKELYRNKIHETNAADELTSLLAQCAITEALPLIPEPPSTSNNTNCSQAVEPDATGGSILAETGRTQVVLDAFSDGSSFVCIQCGGLVSNDRKDEHYVFWCNHS
jgi:formamidopyrimidine-DNA glycosylase